MDAGPSFATPTLTVAKELPGLAPPVRLELPSLTSGKDGYHPAPHIVPTPCTQSSQRLCIVDDDEPGRPCVWVVLVA